MSLTSDLLAVAEIYTRHTGRSRSRIATIIFNDGKKFDLIDNGADLGTKVFERAMAWFSTHWPTDLDWPAEVSRPIAPVVFDELTSTSDEAAA